ncbi:hypothetical protein L195_g007930 [Trifolium pratense]|uniref:Uncharacterized protein n=1 Tax=Trifolium pratense TaxID=57577 RepID=A0A2K3P7R4_TRIPR|nr:hypothetical protein L195_g007930 [Trifolium pratense]
MDINCPSTALAKRWGYIYRAPHTCQRYTTPPPGSLGLNVITTAVHHRLVDSDQGKDQWRRLCQETDETQPNLLAASPLGLDLCRWKAWKNSGMISEDCDFEIAEGQPVTHVLERKDPQWNLLQIRREVFGIQAFQSSAGGRSTVLNIPSPPFRENFETVVLGSSPPTHNRPHQHSKSRLEVVLRSLHLKEQRRKMNLTLKHQIHPSTAKSSERVRTPKSMQVYMVDNYFYRLKTNNARYVHMNARTFV